MGLAQVVWGWNETFGLRRALLFFKLLINLGVENTALGLVVRHVYVTP